MPLPETMRAWRYTTPLRPLETSMQLTTNTLPPNFIPPPAGHELVKIHAMSLNPGDYKLAQNEALLGSVFGWLLIKKPATPGLDFAGEIAVGPRQGVRVFGTLGMPNQYGTLAEYALVKDEVLADVPEGLGWEKAAALGVGAVTSWVALVPFLRARMKKAGKVRVFVNGASGGVGTFMVQVAKALGCHVLVSCSTRNVQLCEDLGADEVVDYMTLEGKDVGRELGRRVREEGMERFDLIVDNVGHDVALHQKSDMFTKADGRFLLVALMDENWSGIGSMLQSWLRPRWLGGARTPWKFVMAYVNKEIMEDIRDWVAAGKVKSVVDEVFGFADAAKAIVKLKTGKAQGNIVVSGMHG